MSTSTILETGDRVITPFGQTGQIIKSKPDQAVPYHSLVQLDDPEEIERVNPRQFMTATLERVAMDGEQLSLLEQAC